MFKEYIDFLLERSGFRRDVNDIHSGLNSTHQQKIFRPRSIPEIQQILRSCQSDGNHISVSSGRHAMGGQQFLENGILLDMRSMNSVRVNPDRQTATIAGGALWTHITAELARLQNHDPFRLTFRQKQTGGDRLSIGGSLSANIHSRGLAFRPFVGDVESFTLISGCGEHQVSRTRESGLWSCAIGGYGLMGVASEIELRLVRRHKLERVVETCGCDGLLKRFQDRIDGGFEYGDFQLAIDPESDDFLNRGVFACYRPVPDDTHISDAQVKVPRAAWHHLVYLAYTHKSEAFELYSKFYERTNGQVYWSDDHQMTPYLDHYHKKLDRRLKPRCAGSEMITELYVPRTKIEEFLEAARAWLRRTGANTIYSTIRLIEPDDETTLAWATQPWICIIFNLHVDHDPEGLQTAKDQFCGLIDIAHSFGGSFYLTYHPWASKSQIEKSYPRIKEFADAKLRHDPEELFSSNWWRDIKRKFEFNSISE